MHWPLAHWFAPPHAPPLANPGWHTPAAQKSPDAQSVSETQLPRHAVGPQTYGLQPCVCCAGQLPAPSQDAWSVAIPALQLAPRQIVAAPGYAHAVELDPSQTPPQRLPPGYAQAVGSVPVQAPAHTEPSEAHAVRALRGAPATAVQVPTLPDSAHAWHWPVHAVSQQTASTQCCDPHWFAPPQDWPCASRGTHKPPEHHFPAVQSESATQSPLQAVAPHVNGAHVCVCTPGHEPAPLHEAASVAVPPAQEGVRHETDG